MNVDDIFESKYLKASDLKGKTVPVVIASVHMAKMGQGDDSDNKPVLMFEGKDKGLVLNKTNTFAIAAVHGKEMTAGVDDDGNSFPGWVGCEIKIYPTTTQFQGKMTDCIRVTVPMPEAGADEEIPF